MKIFSQVLAPFFVIPALFHVIPAKAGIPLCLPASHHGICHPKIVKQSGFPAFAGMTVYKEHSGAGIRMINHVLSPLARGEDNRAMP
jgi:hypothetical protein